MKSSDLFSKIYFNGNALNFKILWLPVLLWVCSCSNQLDHPTATAPTATAATTEPAAPSPEEIALAWAEFAAEAKKSKPARIESSTPVELSRLRSTEASFELVSGHTCVVKIDNFNIEVFGPLDPDDGARVERMSIEITGDGKTLKDEFIRRLHLFEFHAPASIFNCASFQDGQLVLLSLRPSKTLSVVSSKFDEVGPSFRKKSIRSETIVWPTCDAGFIVDEDKNQLISGDSVLTQFDPDALLPPLNSSNLLYRSTNQEVSK